MVAKIQVGETVSARDWDGGLLSLKVRKLWESKEYGPCFDSTDVDGGRHRSLPISHVIETAKLAKIGRGNWEIHLPDGKVVQQKSEKAAKDYAAENGILIQSTGL